MKLREYINVKDKGPAYIGEHQIIEVSPMYRPRFTSGRNNGPVVDVLVKLSERQANKTMTHYKYVGMSLDMTITTTANSGPDLSGQGEAE